MFEVKIIKDSLAPCGKRLTTITATYPRFIHCHDSLTEVLSEVDEVRKFRKWRDLALLPLDQVKLAAYNVDDTLNFENPTELISENYNGAMIECENARLSFSVTPNHRMWVGCRKSWGDKWEIHEAQNLLKCPQRRIKTTGLVSDGQSIGKNLSELLGFFVGDGNIPKLGKQTIFHLSKARKVKYLHKLLRKLKFPFDFRPYKDGTSNTVLDGIIFPEAMSCYATDHKKQIPPIVLKAVPEEMIAFLNGLWNSDGSTDNEITRQHNTSSPHTADGLSALAAMCGKRINLTEQSGGGMYKLCESSEISPIIRSDKNPPLEVPYLGKVYCATVSTGLLLTRRNGLTMISGNSEVLTHRDRARNAASSRAIPWAKMLKTIEENPVIPIRWGSEQKGMQTGGEIKDTGFAQSIWLRARDNAVLAAEQLAELGVHKSLVNRLVEPFMWITVVMSATEWNNFFRLRCHPDAEIHFQKIAGMIREALVSHSPMRLMAGEWHLPFIQRDELINYFNYPTIEERREHLEKLKKVSVARCARISYLTHEGKREMDKDLELFDRLMQGSGFGHLSPFEHVAQASSEKIRSGPFIGWKQFRKEFPLENVEG